MQSDDLLHARRTDRQALIDALGVKVSEGGHCKCFAHDDKSASATMGQGRNGIYRFKCHADGCGFSGDIFDVIAKRRGIPLAQVLKEARMDRLQLAESTSPSLLVSSTTSPKKASAMSKSYATRKEAIAVLDRILAKEGYTRAGTHPYHDAFGAINFAVVRYQKDEGIKKAIKTFRQISKHADGLWYPDAKGLDRHPLFRLPEVIVAVKKHEPVVMGEGEKTAIAICEAGFIGTTTSGGAGKAGLSDLTPLAGASVVLWPDNDPVNEHGRRPGQDHADDILARLAALSPPPVVYMVKVADLREKADAADLTPEEVKARITAALASSPAVLSVPPKPAGTHEANLIDLEGVEEEAVEWLWPGLVACGKIHLFVGDPGQGKTTMGMDIAARITRGVLFPFQSGSGRKPGGVVLLTAEDGLADTLVPRLKAAGANLKFIKALGGGVIWKADGQRQEYGITLQNIEAIEQAIKGTPDCKMLLVDPISAFFGNADSYKEAEVRAMLTPLARLAERYRVAIIFLGHLNKGANMKAIYRISGSVGIIAASRIALGIGRDPKDQDLFWVTPIKSNLGKDSGGISYKIIKADNGSTKIDWLEQREGMTADDLFADAASEDGPNPELDARLRERMEAESPGVPFKTLMAVAKDLGGYKERAVRASLRRLKANKERHGYQGAVIWCLPAKPAKKKSTTAIGDDE